MPKNTITASESCVILLVIQYMKHLIFSSQLLKSIQKRIRGLRCISAFLFLLVLLRKIFESRNQPREKKLNPQNTHEKKIWTHKILTRKILGPMIHLREKLLDPRIPTKKISDPRNTHEKKYRTLETPTKALWQDGTKHTRYTMARYRRNLPHSK